METPKGFLKEVELWAQFRRCEGTFKKCGGNRKERMEGSDQREGPRCGFESNGRKRTSRLQAIGS